MDFIFSGKPTAKLDIPRITITGPDAVTVAWDTVDDEDVTSYTVCLHLFVLY